MSLDLRPEMESRVLEYAAEAGVSVDELMARTFPPRRTPAAPGETPEETAQRVQSLLTKWQAKNPLPVPPGGFKSLAELSAEWQAEDAHLTEAEREAQRRLWAEHEAALISSPGVSI